MKKPICGLLLAVLLALTLSRPAQAGGPRTYILQPGEGLVSVARYFGTSVETLVALNALPDASVARAGQRLRVPDQQFRAAYTVRQGDTITSIAARFGLPADQLANQSGVADLNRLEAGQTLTLSLSSSLMGADALPAGLLSSLLLTPWPAIQGQSVTLMAFTSQPVSLTVRFLDLEMPVIPDAGRQWALLGVPAMLAPGAYPVQVRAQAGADACEAILRLIVLEGQFATYDIVLTPESGKADLLDPELIRLEGLRVNEVFARRTPRRLWSGEWTSPLRIDLLENTSSTYGERRSYNGGPVSSFHEGWDIAAPEGTPVLAPANAIVALAEPLKVRGNAIILDHGYGVLSGYWHLSEIGVKAGDAVRAGQVIGKVGTTGLSTGSHLHWELRVGGIPVNPLEWTQRPVL
jgi:murein DD-endopeptidase MepM/ murein hydrolase activator NlpD